MKDDQLPTRRPGAVGALMDEYERACGTLIRTLQGVAEVDFTRVVDRETKDDACRSIQTIVGHVLASGYGYADYIRTSFGINKNSPPPTLPCIEEFPESLRKMLQYAETTLEGRWEIDDEEIAAIRMRVRWGTTYDLEQLLEHAIVHILRHRRQIEHFLALMETGSGG